MVDSVITLYPGNVHLAANEWERALVGENGFIASQVFKDIPVLTTDSQEQKAHFGSYVRIDTVTRGIYFYNSADNTRTLLDVYYLHSSSAYQGVFVRIDLYTSALADTVTIWCPIYDASHNTWFAGLGDFKQVLSARVSEGLNNQFECALAINREDALAQAIANGMCISIKPNMSSKRQLFRIISHQRTLDNQIDIAAVHISYDMSGQIILGNPDAGFSASVYNAFSPFVLYSSKSVVKKASRAYQSSKDLVVPYWHFLSSYEGKDDTGVYSNDTYFDEYDDDVEYVLGDCVSYTKNGNTKNYCMVWHDNQERIIGQNPYDNPDKWHEVSSKELYHAVRSFSLNEQGSSGKADPKIRNTSDIAVSSAGGFKFGRYKNYIVGVGRDEFPFIQKQYINSGSDANRKVSSISTNKLNVVYSDDNGNTWNTTTIEVPQTTQTWNYMKSATEQSADYVESGGALDVLKVFNVGNMICVIFAGYMYGSTHKKSDDTYRDLSIRAYPCIIKSSDNGKTWQGPWMLISNYLAAYPYGVGYHIRYDNDSYNLFYNDGPYPDDADELIDITSTDRMLATIEVTDNAVRTSDPLRKDNAVITTIPGPTINQYSLHDGFSKEHRFPRTSSDGAHYYRNISGTLLASIKFIYNYHNTTAAGNRENLYYSFASWELVETDEDYDGAISTHHAYTNLVPVQDYLYSSIFALESLQGKRPNPDDNIDFISRTEYHPFSDEYINIFGAQYVNARARIVFRKGLLSCIENLNVSAFRQGQSAVEFKHMLEEDDEWEDFDEITQNHTTAGTTGVIDDVIVGVANRVGLAYDSFKKALIIPVERTIFKQSTYTLSYEESILIIGQYGFYAIRLFSSDYDTDNKNDKRIHVKGEYFRYNGITLSNMEDATFMLQADGVHYALCLFEKTEHSARCVQVRNIDNYFPAFNPRTNAWTYYINVAASDIMAYANVIVGDAFPYKSSENGQIMSDFMFTDWNELEKETWAVVKPPAKLISQLVDNPSVSASGQFLNDVRENSKLLLAGKRDLSGMFVDSLIFHMHYQADYAEPTVENDPECDDNAINFQEPRSLRDILGNDVLPKFHRKTGPTERKHDPLEVMFDNNDVVIFGSDRGIERDYTFVAGIDILTADLTNSIDACYYAVYPYYYTEGSDAVDLASFGQDRLLYSNVLKDNGVRSIFRLDLSTIQDSDGNQKFESAPGAYEDIIDAVNQYEAQYHLLDPQISLELTITQFRDGIGMDADELLEIDLGDTINVVIPSAGYSSKLRIIELEYDALTGQYTSLKLGTNADMLDTTIAGIEQAVKNENKRAAHSTATKRFVLKEIKKASS